MKKKSYNLLNKTLQTCSLNPLTGFFRDGCCTSSKRDIGEHFVCAKLTDDFLKFSLSKGNDLITPKPQYNFPGLVEGDSWCLCTSRWIEALNNGVAPKIYFLSTNKLVLKKIKIEILKKFALDIN